MTESPVDRTTSCGLGRWRPKFMQILASKKVYMFFYGAIGIIKVSQNFRYSRNYVDRMLFVLVLVVSPVQLE